ncbi:OmpH family outer membrane protein [Salegentibacter chungangensis]|uniref:OmpH family outer membrane protein n=1 Tax=Salegentibacter chungangensis TaxID=1335724 RepID=A0ABW3NKL6_9FLAO
MKSRILFLALLILSTASSLQAQRSIRVGYVDMEYILQNVPEYQEASSQLDAKVQEWKQEAEKNQREIDDMKTRLENERALLTKELIEEREEEIAYREQEAVEYQQKRFGPDGDYMIQKRQLIRPIQDQVFAAVQEIAKNRSYDFIFDRTSENGMVYAAKQHDVSDQVLRSINRAQNRSQLDSKEEIREMEKAEERTVEEDAEIAKKESAVEKQKDERAALIEQRKKERDSIRAAKQREFEERRQRILKERQQRKDSIEAARAKKDDQK